MKKTKTRWGHIGDEFKYNLSFKEKGELTEKDFNDIDITILEIDIRSHLLSHEHDFESVAMPTKVQLLASLQEMKKYNEEWVEEYAQLREEIQIGIKANKLAEYMLQHITKSPRSTSLAIKRMMQISLEGNDDYKNRCLEAIIELVSKHEIDKVHLRRAFDIIYLNISDIAIDSPYIIYYLKKIWMHLLKSKVIYPNFLLKIPPDIVKLSSIEAGLKDSISLQASSIIYSTTEVKNEILNVVKEVLSYKNYGRLTEFLTLKSEPVYHPLVIKAGLLHALESKDEEKVEFCNVMEFMKSKFHVKYWAFSHVFDDMVCLADNYEPDFPNYIEDVSKFIRAAVQLNTLPSMFLMHPDPINVYG